jgi:hypothetical protein
MSHGSPLWSLLGGASGCLLAAVVAVATPRAASAQVIADVERQLLAERAGVLSTLEPAFWNALSVLRKEEDRQRALKADISFGLTGDEAGERSLFKLNTGISLSRGEFPSEVNVVSKLGLQQRDGQLQEDVTSLLISYDYHTTRHVEYFAFAERFSDNFLSIQQRYEIGFGARAGFHFGSVPSWNRVADSFDTVRAGLASVRAAVPKMPARGQVMPNLGPDESSGLPLATRRLEHALRDQSARVFLGLVASVFAELERAEIEVTSRPAVGSVDPVVTSKVPVDATYRYRLTIRPAIRLRPSEEITIVIHPYYKLPLDGARRVTAADGTRRLDYRRDVMSEMEWTIKQEQTGLESVGFLVTVNHFFDNVPPTVPEAFVANALAAGRTLTRLEAERSHRVVALSLKLKW